MKTFGYKTIMSFPGTLAMFYIITHNLLIVTTATLVLIIFTIFFVPLIKISDNTIRIIPFNPFAQKINILFADISSINIHAGDFRFKLSFQMKNGDIITTSSFFRYYDMESIYRSLREHDVVIASKGVNAITWEV